MAAVDPDQAQVNDPELEADLSRLLSIVGRLGKLNVLDFVLPTVSLGNVVTQAVDVLQGAFRSTDVFSAGSQVNAPVGTVHADTGPVAAGIYDIQASASGSATQTQQWNFEHRNATNTATLAVWSIIVLGTVSTWTPWTFGYELANNERLRITNANLVPVNVSSIAFLMARRRV